MTSMTNIERFCHKYRNVYEVMFRQILLKYMSKWSYEDERNKQ